MCGHPPELEILCDECFAKNRHHDCETCTHYKTKTMSGIELEYCSEKENGVMEALPDERKCLLYTPKFCRSCNDNLDRLCFCCGIQFEEPVDGCCQSCRDGDHVDFNEPPEWTGINCNNCWNIDTEAECNCPNPEQRKAEAKAELEEELKDAE